MYYFVNEAVLNEDNITVSDNILAYGSLVLQRVHATPSTLLYITHRKNMHVYQRIFEIVYFAVGAHRPVAHYCLLN